MRTLYLCLDGGGTKTESLLCDAQGRVLGRGRSGGSNPLSVGRESAVRHALAAAEQALGGRALDELAAVGLYIPGFEYAVDALPEAFRVLSPTVESDALSAYYACLTAPGGIVVLAGTGSFAFGMAEDGQTKNAGGWGHILGDEGSGYDIGREALRHLLRLDEKKAPYTALDDRVMEVLDIRARRDLIGRVYDPAFDRTRMASLCPAVAEAACLGDAGALAILRSAAGRLARLAGTVNERLGAKVRPASLTGGVAKIGKPLIHPFAQALSQGTPPLSYTPCRFSPLFGGMIHLLMSHNHIPNWLKEGEPLC